MQNSCSQASTIMTKYAGMNARCYFAVTLFFHHKLS